MKKTHWAVIAGVAFLIAAFITYTVHFWNNTPNDPKIFAISFVITLAVIFLGQMLGRRKA